MSDLVPIRPNPAAEIIGGINRRDFLQWVSATLAAMGVGCRGEPERVLPYTRRPEGVIPGQPLHFATSMPFGGLSSGLVIESHEGRPTKIEGNPKHPDNRGVAGPALAVPLGQRQVASGVAGRTQLDLPRRRRPLARHWQ